MPNDEGTQPITLRLPWSMYKALLDIKQETQVPMNAQIVKAIEAALAAKVE